eukprot:Anaeramoba_flamelloidesa820779_12.p2 GENE.a820779_12~~a820779_12.p2  ORF type:complete len:131 (+),score=18.42 a820779_12:304-696(+)
MHNIKLICSSVILLMLFSFSKADNENDRLQMPSSETYIIPTDVNAILKRSCFDCHHSDSKKLLAKGKLSFDKLEELKDVKKIATYKKIEKEIREDKMPPKKYLKRNPEKTITEEEKEILFQWINKELEKK